MKHTTLSGIIHHMVWCGALFPIDSIHISFDTHSVPWIAKAVDKINTLLNWFQIYCYYTSFSSIFKSICIISFQYVKRKTRIYFEKADIFSLIFYIWFRVDTSGVSNLQAGNSSLQYGLDIREYVLYELWDC